MSKITKDFVLQRGSVGDKTIQFFLTFNHEAATKEVPNGQLFFLKNLTDWASKDFAWTGVSLSSETDPASLCYVLGRDGEVLIGDSTGFSEERIRSEGMSPLTRGPLQDIKIVAHAVYAVGMGRQVYKRIGREQWQIFESGIPASEKGKIVGFNAIAGLTESEIYAVGWKGEIWLCDGKEWALTDSPTNRMLRDVVIGSDGTVYICGKGGIIISGRHGDWSTVDHKGPVADWLTMAWFKGALFLGDGYALYSLRDSDLQEVSIPGEGKLPIVDLDSTDVMLLAVGGDCAFASENGVDWQRLPA